MFSRRPILFAPSAFLQNKIGPDPLLHTKDQDLI